MHQIIHITSLFLFHCCRTGCFAAHRKHNLRNDMRLIAWLLTRDPSARFTCSSSHLSQRATKPHPEPQVYTGHSQVFPLPLLNLGNALICRNCNCSRLPVLSSEQK
jgi:hypothetical protein